MQQLLPFAQSAIESGNQVQAVLPIRNVNRVVGTILGSEITRKYGLEGLPDDTVKFNLLALPDKALGPLYLKV